MTRALSIVLISCLISLPLTGCATPGPPRIDAVGSDAGAAANTRRDNDWSRVMGLPRGSTIKVTLKGGSPAGRTFVAADDVGLIALNLTDADLPLQVTLTLSRLASKQPSRLVSVSRGQTVTEEHVRLGPEGVFLKDRKVAEVDQVVERVARDRIAEISHLHASVKRGLGWGALIGAGVGLAITFAQCGTHWNEESGGCSNLTPLSIIVGPLAGMLVGGAVGTAWKTATVIYRAE